MGDTGITAIGTSSEGLLIRLGDGSMGTGDRRGGLAGSTLMSLDVSIRLRVVSSGYLLMMRERHSHD